MYITTLVHSCIERGRKERIHFTETEVIFCPLPSDKVLWRCLVGPGLKTNLTQLTEMHEWVVRLGKAVAGKDRRLIVSLFTENEKNELWDWSQVPEELGDLYDNTTSEATIFLYKIH